VTEKLVVGAFPPLYTNLHVFIFASTLLVYNVHYLVKKAKLHQSDQYAWVQQHKWLNYIFASIGFILSLVYFFRLPIHLRWTSSLLAVLSFAYSLPILPFLHKQRLKDIGWLKGFLLAAVWTMVTAVLPIVYYRQSALSYPFECLLRFIFMLLLCLAFDIRDMKVDQEQGIDTMPSRLGLVNTYALMNGLAVLFIGLTSIQFLRFEQCSRLWVLVFSAMSTIAAIHHVRKHPSDRNYILFVDGQMFLQALLLVLF
jgi:4-hydroxybenzoate polyprenyltransferase